MPISRANWQVDFVKLDLAEAIRKAGPGDVIEIAPGRHTLRERIIVNKPLTIRGAGRNRTHLLSSEELFAIQFIGTEPWTLEGLTIEHVGEAVADVVVVEGGDITTRGCRFTGAVFHEKAEQLRGGSGIVLRGNARGLVFECICDGNALRGIAVWDQARPVLEGNTCENNTQDGIAYLENAGGTARKNTCRGNGLYGIYIAKGANPKLEDNQLSGNKAGDLRRGE